MDQKHLSCVENIWPNLHYRLCLIIAAATILLTFVFCMLYEQVVGFTDTLWLNDLPLWVEPSEMQSPFIRA
jgi:hypothetical protein